MSNALFETTSPGAFATARRGGIDLTEVQFIADKLLEGGSVQSISRMVGRPACDVAAVAATLPRNARRAYGPAKPQVVFLQGWDAPEHGLLRIAREVAAKHKLTVAELRGPSAKHTVAHPRQEAFWLSRAAGYPTTQIGQWYGGRDHTTILWGVRQHQRRLDEANGG